MKIVMSSRFLQKFVIHVLVISAGNGGRIVKASGQPFLAPQELYIGRVRKT